MDFSASPFIFLFRKDVTKIYIPTTKKIYTVRTYGK